MKAYIYVFALLTLACSPQGSKSNNISEGTDNSLFSDFSDPKKYAKIVSDAEAGDEYKTGLLVSYYSTPVDSDLRNLLYWTEKYYKIIGSEAYTNYILKLARLKRCGEAWELVEKYFSMKSKFAFYKVKGGIEYLDDFCPRSK
jgi:hypothetical protein